MDADERSICIYLKSYAGEFISGREISRRAGGKWRFRHDPHWATPVLSRLAEKGIIEQDSTGHFRFIKKDTKPKRYLSPQIKKILEHSSKDFGHVTEIDEDLDEI